jgi:hypothetical protein
MCDAVEAPQVKAAYDLGRRQEEAKQKKTQAPGGGAEVDAEGDALKAENIKLQKLVDEYLKLSGEAEKEMGELRVQNQQLGALVDEFYEMTSASDSEAVGEEKDRVEHVVERKAEEIAKRKIAAALQEQRRHEDALKRELKVHEA